MKHFFHEEFKVLGAWCLISQNYCHTMKLLLWKRPEALYVGHCCCCAVSESWQGEWGGNWLRPGMFEVTIWRVSIEVFGQHQDHPPQWSHRSAANYVPPGYGDWRSSKISESQIKWWGDHHRWLSWSDFRGWLIEMWPRVTWNLSGNIKMENGT